MQQPTPSDWLAANAIEQRLSDREILHILRDAYREVNRDLSKLARSGTPGAAIRRDQLLSIKRNLLEQQAHIFARAGRVIEERRVRAAARAIQLSGTVDEVAFAALGRGPEARALARGLEETQLRTIDAAIARVTQSHTALSTRVYRARAFADGMLERRINSGLARGLSAEQMAAELRQFVNPATPGGVRFAALRLARTEINNAFHALSIAAARAKPWVTKMRWHKSRSHAKLDICDGLDGRVFDIDEVPPKPHPLCLCIVTPEVGATPEDDAAFLDALAGGEFDKFLEEFATRHGL